jgi:hypothetical protein
MGMFAGSVSRSVQRSARTNFPATLGYGGESVRATAEVVAGDYFGVLGLKPRAGRLLTLEDEANRTPAIVLSYAYWANRLGLKADIVNNRMLLNGHPVLVVGVAPTNFRGLLAGQTPDLFAPVSPMDTISPDWKTDSVEANWLNLVGRLKPGVNAAKADAALGPLFHAILADHIQQMPDLSAEYRKAVLQKQLHVQPAAQGLNRLQTEWKSPLTVLLVMVGLLLLIACANIAGLLLVRAVARQRELALRFALGASRWQVARQLLIESLGLAVTVCSTSGAAALPD